MDKIKNLISKLSKIKTPETVFNPYRDICKVHDKNDASKIRKENLENLLETHLRLKPDIIWVFEANSYLGGRRSGVPFINETMYEEVEDILGTEKPFQKATKTETKTALTTTMAWNLAKELNIKPLMWESIPFHFHKNGNPFSNRSVTEEEAELYKNFLTDILEIYQPSKVLAVGRTSEHILNSLGIKNTYVRHPAHGGFPKFRKGIIKILKHV